ncbi:MAG: hypothetical protein IPK22_07555 [Verrucomicrobiaceae bacterium]|nr:hypothetical protein [Verrucomicrobiaceae bacterium]
MKALPLLIFSVLPCLAAEPAGKASLAEEHHALTRQRDELRAAATALCTELRRERISGLPSPAQMKRLEGMLTPPLASVIEVARTRQQEQMRQHPDEKPQWVEGDLFSSLFEGVKTWEIGEVFAAPSTEATVKVHNSYDEPGLDKVEWTDTWVFQRLADRWRLDDIRMGGEWAFRSGASLRHALPGGGKEEGDHDSPDEKWHVTFTRDGDEVTRITLKSHDAKIQPVVLFGDKPDESCPMPCWLVWNPSCDRLALRLGDGPRFTRTQVFRFKDGSWQPLPLPDFFAKEKKTLASHGFDERDGLVDAEYWRDADTLVLTCFGSFTKGDEGDGFHKRVSVRFNVSGQAKVIDAVDAPAEP